MLLPLVSIVIATFNSAKVLPRTLKAISAQSYPKDKIEIIIVDGGSDDATLKLAKKYKCRVIPNPKTDPVNAKLLGFRSACGKYVITMDHDEVLENKDSIAIKVKVLEKNEDCKVVLCSGYKRPKGYPPLNQYISEFGDPFSLFLYHFSKDYQFFGNNLKSQFKVIEDKKEYFIVSIEDMRKPIIMELCCMGTMVEREFFGKIPNAFENGAVFVHLFYIMLEQGINRVAMVKNDSLLHYSVDSLAAYIPKLKWRIINNVHFQEQGKNGFSGREKYQNTVKARKFFFPVYAVSVVCPLIESIYYFISRKNLVYLLHMPLSLYVFWEILHQYVLKMLKRTPHFTSYDGKKIIIYYK